MVQVSRNITKHPYFIGILFAFLIGATYFFVSPKSSKSLPIIAISQIIEHNTLDTVREGLLQQLQEDGFIDGETVRIAYENAHGNLTIASQIASKFSNLSPKVMVALSTQSAQTLSQTARSKEIPLVFSAVTDPVAAKLVPSFEDTSNFITGISDYMPARPQLEMMQKFLPNLKRLGVLYNPSEVNSVSYLKHVEEDAKAMGITLVYAPLNNTSEAATATTSLIGKVDALYFPNDNTAMAAVGAIVSVAHKNKIPVFANDSASVEQGAVAALAYDRVAMGRKTGQIVVALLHGEPTSHFPVTTDVPLKTVTNQVALHQLRLREY